MPIDKYRSQPSSNKHLFAVDRDNYRKPQSMKIQRINDCVALSPD